MIDNELARIDQYLQTIEGRRSPATIRAVRRDLTQFATWWEETRRRPFDPALLRDADMRAWQRARQVDDGMVTTMIERAGL